jgi:hypothetical protein
MKVVGEKMVMKVRTTLTTQLMQGLYPRSEVVSMLNMVRLGGQMRVSDDELMTSHHADIHAQTEP